MWVHYFCPLFFRKDSDEQLMKKSRAGHHENDSDSCRRYRKHPKSQFAGNLCKHLERVYLKELAFSTKKGQQYGD
ncbi:hypothetical protein Y032_0656g1218 [Ancylostoma ceylanicum]|uniref:Uncharacterized protein n=1 Tax=Ancylostoma ceylanicum TaxID=53326 RepID=A0A016WK82_9BILA|nr:hypothetical protein Y032_0656g1218 [Ancylostoma ceylanicum]